MNKLVITLSLTIFTLLLIFSGNSTYSKNNEGKMADKKYSGLINKLSDEQHNVMFCEATERPFSSELLHEKRMGNFTCAACGQVIFDSNTKYDSQTGWPSFYDAVKGSVEFKEDNALGMTRVEFHCSKCGAHFGHVFDDGPKPTKKRYCTNGIALKFVPDEVKNKTEQATFAGGCFWCMQPIFDELEGVTKTEVGYSGGNEEKPTYEEVSSKATGHLEVIQISFNPTKVSFETLLDKFMKNIDPTDPEGQFFDKGPQYMTAVFYHNEEQKNVAESYFRKLRESKILNGQLATTIKPFKVFYAAEDYHQKYYEKNKIRYEIYKQGSGRKSKLEEVWGKE